MPVERISISAAIYNQSRDRVIGILRANDPNDRLAGFWGLPAVSLHTGEDDRSAVQRIGWQKLGTSLKPEALIGEKTSMISDRLRLTMRLWEASLQTEPNFDMRDLRDRDVSQYVTWAWMSPDEFIPTARKQSLCTQLLLEKQGVIYE